MIIEYNPSTGAEQYAYLNRLPDPFVSEKKKKDPSYIKNVLDFYANKAVYVYKKNTDSNTGFTKNYGLLKGIVNSMDYVQEDPETFSTAEALFGDTALPSWVKHYSILNPPLNTMVGELSKRPDSRRVKAFDSDSQNEELQFRTQLMQQYILQEAKERVINKMVMQGQDPSHLSEDDMQKLTLEDIQEEMEDFTTMGEKWGNHAMAANKVRFGMKEKGEDAFRDLLAASREFFHIYEDNSRVGFNVEVVNPKNHWKFSTPDKKWSKDWYAQGMIEVMEISEIIEKFPQITQEEIDHLRDAYNEEYPYPWKASSNFDSSITGPASVKYDTYDQYLEEQRMILQNELLDQSYNEVQDIINQPNTNFYSLGYHYVVVTTYYWGKRLVGNLTYIDEQGNEQSTLVDDTYKEGDHPGEVDITWGWINQLYKGIKIGNCIYHLDKFNLLPYMPVIGMIHEIKNTQARSLIDLMKPFQILYNVCMNKIWQLMQDEKGVVMVTNIHKIPNLKEGDDRDAINIHEAIIRETGTVYEDTSPENMRVVGNTELTKAVDLSRTREIQEKISTAQALKLECWELVGMNRQRLGQSQASQTASANQNDLYQSFNQTEPYFSAHEYLMLQVDQAMLDATKYIESKKPNSVLSYIDTAGVPAFFQVAGEDLLADLQIFVTSRPEDQQIFQESKALVQPMMQNGGSIDEALQVISTDSIRELRRIGKRIEDKRDQQMQQQQALEQQKVQQEQQLAQATMQQQDSHFQQEQQLRKYIADTNNQTQIAKAEIATYFQAPITDGNGNGQPDIVDIANASAKAQEVLAKADLENKKLNLQYQQMQQETKQREEDRKVERERLKADIQIAKSKPKPKTPKKR